MSSAPPVRLGDFVFFTVGEGRTRGEPRLALVTGQDARGLALHVFTDPSWDQVGYAPGVMPIKGVAFSAEPRPNTWRPIGE